MSLRDLHLEKSYDSDSDDILTEFFIPALSESIRYERLAGFFSSTTLAIAARGIIGLIQNGGTINLICGAKLQREDVEAILEAQDNVIGVITRNATLELENIQDLENEFVENHVKALAWMMANGLLEIKIAVVRDEKNRPLDYQQAITKGIFHQKVGILRDDKGNILSFSGSDNETASGWIENIEEFKVFCSWEDSQREYLITDINRFQKFWFGSSERTDIFDIPDAVRNKFLEIAPHDIKELDITKTYLKSRKHTVRLFKHQIEAMNKWISNGNHCIFEMATGTGKTYAAIQCLKWALSKQRPVVAIITCPFSHLISQWQESIKNLNVDVPTVLAFGGAKGWRDILADRLLDVRNGMIKALIILTTHDTHYRPDFQDLVFKVDSKFFLIADEVHGLGSEMRKLGLNPGYDYRLGLSATPSRWFDPEGTALLLEFFGIKSEQDFFTFSLRDAINTVNPETGQTFLAPYVYRPYFSDLTDEEISEYIDKSSKIAQSYYGAQNEEEKGRFYELLCFQRQQIIQNAVRKYNVFETILDDIHDLKHCLVYCSPQQIKRVQEVLNNRGIVQHKFTQEESAAPGKKLHGKSERDTILQLFAEGTYQALVAMKCLDEGVDIPQAKTAIILSSTGNPREYVQRRGRLLRRFPGKEFSTIYDVIVFPSLEFFRRLKGPLAEFEKKLVASELKRYEEFSSTANNFIECLKILRDIEAKLEL